MTARSLITHVTVPCRNERLFHSEVLALSPGHSEILSHSHGEKSGEGLVPILRHGPEMVDSVSNDGNVPMQYVANTASDRIVKLA